MKKLNFIYEKKIIKKVIDKCEDEHTKECIKNYFLDIQKNGKDFQSPARVLTEISNNYPENLWMKKLIDYFNVTSVKERLNIKRGEVFVKEYEEKLHRRPKSLNGKSIFQREYWIEKGYDENSAIEKVKDIQSKNAKKRLKKSYKNHDLKIKHSIKYWINLGYTKEESIILRQPFLDKMLNDENSFIKRYGEERGREKYIKRVEKYKNSCESNKHNKRIPGYVSKESLKFFIPLYKKCRKLGISRRDIYFGIGGSREFFLRHDSMKNCGRFFDFCLHKLKIIVEYNGTFWHPKDRKKWKNPWINFDDAMSIEIEKELLCKRYGYKLIKVWSDDNMYEKIIEIFNIIKDEYERRLCE